MGRQCMVLGEVEMPVGKQLKLSLVKIKKFSNTFYQNFHINK